MKKAKPAPIKSKPSGVAFGLNGGEIPDASDIPCILGGTSKEVSVPRSVLRRVAFLQKRTEAQIIETMTLLHGVTVNIIDWPETEPFFLIAGSDRCFPDDKSVACCNCQKALLMSGNAPDNAVPICMRCVQFQAILANMHGVTQH